jgi:hypothetical protein
MPVIPNSYKYIKNNTKVEVLAPETNYQSKNCVFKENVTADMIQ